MHETLHLVLATGASMPDHAQAHLSLPPLRLLVHLSRQQSPGPAAAAHAPGDHRWSTLPNTNSIICNGTDKLCCPLLIRALQGAAS
jgi:hypothetical protein